MVKPKIVLKYFSSWLIPAILGGLFFMWGNHIDVFEPSFAGAFTAIVSFAFGIVYVWSNWSKIEAESKQEKTALS